MPSLVSLAQEKNLPYHQYMDVETIERLAENNPFSNIEQINKPTLLGICDIMLTHIAKVPIPDKSWFLKDEEYETIHGIRHLYRVGLYGLVLGVLNKLSDKDLDCLIRSCVLHDIRRLHDKDDKEHGNRCAIWLRENHHQIILNINEDELIESISYIISMHDLPGGEIPNDVNLENNFKLLSLLKTCDALDRYRLPKLKRWINDEFLEYKPSLEYKMFAHQLVVESEKIYLQESNGVASIKKALLVLRDKYAQ